MPPTFENYSYLSSVSSFINQLLYNFELAIRANSAIQKIIHVLNIAELIQGH